MKRQKTKAIWTVLVAVLFLFLPSCEREEDLTAGRIEVLSEKYGGSSAKLAVCDSVSTWSSGDRLRINSSVAEVEIIDGHAYIADAVASDVNRALFPATLASGDLSSDEVTVTLPAAYHYRTDGSGRQLLDIPMAATSSGTNPLEFKHLTGLLCITIRNANETGTFSLFSLKISSNKYLLSGNRDIDFSAITSIAPVITDISANKSVSMVFDEGITVASNATLSILIPVLPVGEDNVFTVSLDATIGLKRFTLTRSQGSSEGTDRSLARNQIGYVYSSTMNMTRNSSEDLFPLTNGYFVLSTPQDISIFSQAINNDYIVGSERNQNPPVYYYSKRYKLANDIDMSGYTISAIKEFSGEFNGNGNVISNLTIEGVPSSGNSNVYECALFQKISSSGTIHDITLSNLSLVHPVVDCTTLKLAGICSEPSIALTIENCTVSIASVQVNGSISDAIFLGGIIGNTAKSVTIDNCSVTMSGISMYSPAKLYYGGFIGRANYSTLTEKTTISNSNYSGNVILLSAGVMYAGGLIGYDRDDAFKATNCSMDGSISVSAATSYLGKYVGWLGSSSSFSISGCTNSVSFTRNGDSYDAPNRN